MEKSYRQIRINRKLLLIRKSVTFLNWKNRNKILLLFLKLPSYKYSMFKANDKYGKLRVIKEMFMDYNKKQAMSNL